MPNLFFLLPYFSSLFALPSIPSLLLNEVAQSASGEDDRVYLGEWEGSGERNKKINPIYRNEEDRENYNQTIAYLKKSKEFQKIFKRLEDSEIVYYIIFIDTLKNQFSPIEFNKNINKIQWNPYYGAKINQGKLPPASTLAHEMTHAYHYDTGEIRTRPHLEEEEITTKVEGIINQVLNLPKRKNYRDFKDISKPLIPHQHRKKYNEKNIIHFYNFHNSSSRHL